MLYGLTGAKQTILGHASKTGIFQTDSTREINIVG